jgi:hypothetical protein
MMRQALFIKPGRGFPGRYPEICRETTSECFEWPSEFGSKALARLRDIAEFSIALVRPSYARCGPFKKNRCTECR